MIVLSLAGDFQNPQGEELWATWVSCSEGKYINKGVLSPRSLFRGADLQSWVLFVGWHNIPLGSLPPWERVCAHRLLRVGEGPSLVPQLLRGWKCLCPRPAGHAAFCGSSQVRRSPAPGAAVKVLICIPWEKLNLFVFGMHLVPAGGSQIGGATTNSCSDWDKRTGQWQKITRIKAVSLTKWWLKRAKEM